MFCLRSSSRIAPHYTLQSFKGSCSQRSGIWGIRLLEDWQMGNDRLEFAGIGLCSYYFYPIHLTLGLTISTRLHSWTL
ncbi:hypothetical protein BT96DRAFT_101579 [Gymnopus androsaceus JB14]|uniref:Uncharacterized protein n=1 Tax=Gymnopus androsaceus JB14 TaxID=1447944 RepID=A0A6A4HDW8_9AGAR|nr:hypothetical protein BT96DRAFT_101579 [Gymnopus androsaceus JB14]